MTNAAQTRADCSGPAKPEPGHDTFVTITNALLDARDKSAACNDLKNFDLKAAFCVLMALGLDQATVLEAMHDADPNMKAHDGTIDAARSNYCDDDCEIDDKPLLSVSDQGVWVSAWVHVALDQDEKWFCDNCGETSMDGSGVCVLCGAEEEDGAAT